MATQFNPRCSTWAMNSIIFQLINEPETIDLEPLYQRKIVWNEEKKIQFISTIMKDYPCPNILINLDTINNSMIIMDGKQRLTSLKEFKQNIIYWLDDDNNKVYYDKAPKNEPNYRTLNPREMSVFNHRQIQIIEYRDVPYEIQAEMFERVQNGVVISYPDLMISFIRNDITARTFRTNEKKLLNMIKRFADDKLNWLINDDNFRIFLVKAVHHFIEPNKILQKKDDKDFLMNIEKKNLIKIFDILNEYIMVFDNLKKYKLPECIYFNIILMVMNYKYKDTKYLDKTNKTIIKNHGDTFKNYNFLLQDNIDLDNKIKEIKDEFDKTIKAKANLNNIFKGKKKSELREILRKNYINNITSIRTVEDHKKVLTNYYNIFGFVV